MADPRNVNGSRPNTNHIQSSSLHHSDHKPHILPLLHQNQTTALHYHHSLHCVHPSPYIHIISDPIRPRHSRARVPSLPGPPWWPILHSLVKSSIESPQEKKKRNPQNVIHERKNYVINKSFPIPISQTKLDPNECNWLSLPLESTQLWGSLGFAWSGDGGWSLSWTVWACLLLNEWWKRLEWEAIKVEGLQSAHLRVKFWGGKTSWNIFQ